MIDIMVDLETMSSSSNAPIVQIGAVRFDRGVISTMAELLENSFLVNVRLDGQTGRVNDNTLRWWMQQSDRARAALSDPMPMLIPQALDRFYQWIFEQGSPVVRRDLYMWSHATFDAPIIEFAYEQHSSEGEPPWKYNMTRDLRTLVDLSYGDEKVPGVPSKKVSDHTGDADAARQAIMAQQCFEKLYPG